MEKLTQVMKVLKQILNLIQVLKTILLDLVLKENLNLSKGLTFHIKLNMRLIQQMEKLMVIKYLKKEIHS